MAASNADMRAAASSFAEEIHSLDGDAVSMTCDSAKGSITCSRISSTITDFTVLRTAQMSSKKNITLRTVMKMMQFRSSVGSLLDGRPRGCKAIGLANKRVLYILGFMTCESFHITF
eukprot:1837356-Pyramimonas_sp.AAC.1